MAESLDQQTDQLLSLIKKDTDDPVGAALATTSKPVLPQVQETPQVVDSVKQKCFDYTIKKSGRRVMFYQITEPDGSIWHRVLICVDNGSGGYGVVGRKDFNEKSSHRLATALQKLVKVEE